MVRKRAPRVNEERAARGTLSAMTTRTLALLALCALGCARCGNSTSSGPSDSMATDSSASADVLAPLDAPAEASADAPAAALTVTSSAFAEGAAIPAVHAYAGCGAGASNLSPPLAWTGAPASARSFALWVEDPDAPSGTFTHWLAWNLSSSTASLPQGVTLSVSSFLQGRNDFGEQGYGGPCPPNGQHRYVFHVYALSVASLSLPATSGAAELRAALQGNILAQGALTGTYRQ